MGCPDVIAVWLAASLRLFIQTWSTRPTLLSHTLSPNLQNTINSKSLEIRTWKIMRKVFLCVFAILSPTF